jgi:uncharacterized protein YqgC (DUF456 family)
METIICIFTFLFLLAGVAAVFVPGVPTPLLSWLGVLLCAVAWKGGPVNGILLAVATALTALAHIFEFVGSYFGAKWFGASWRGGLGAFAGGILGMIALLLLPVPGGVFFAIAGLFAGPFIGAVVGELLGNREWREAAKSGLGTVLGNFAAMLLKLAITLLLLAGFTVALVVHLLAR